MRLVADECVDFGIIRKLRENNVEVFAIVEETASIIDNDVLKIANERAELLLTQDKDFGELVFRLKLPNYGVVLIRMDNDTREIRIKKVVTAILDNFEQMYNHFSVILEDKIKIRKI